MKVHEANQAARDIATLRPFIGRSQLATMAKLAKGEEGEHFRAKLSEMAEIVRTMPKTYEQDGKGDQAIAYLHYFRGGMDWHITEKDAETEDAPGQLQAFGLCDLGYGPELGYVSIDELTAQGVELDLYWTPATIGEIRKAQAVA